jgi:hypothetical protein
MLMTTMFPYISNLMGAGVAFVPDVPAGLIMLFCVGVGFGVGFGFGVHGRKSWRDDVAAKRLNELNELDKLRVERLAMSDELKRVRMHNKNMSLRIDRLRATNNTLTKLVNRSRNRNLLFCDDKWNMEVGFGGLVVDDEYAIVRVASCET